MLSKGHHITRLVRIPQSHERDVVYWNPAKGEIDSDALHGIEAVIHLAGENIASGRWTSGKKERIRTSRIDGTRLLSEAIASLQPRPSVFLSASAIGYYGDRGEQELDETSSPGEGFLADVCRQWEEMTKAATTAGIRTVRMRFGMVLASNGGALAKMLPAFRLGLGGRLGNGRQYVSWISLPDVVGAISHCLQTDAVAGAVNFVSPTPVTNREFTATLGKVLHRSTFLPAPAGMLKLFLGEMAQELLLASTKVKPTRLLESGYRFHHPQLPHALEEILG